MEKQIVFSVIIPVYNAAEYLPETLKNIPSGENMRFIFADDGSEDDTPVILREYCKKDGRAVYLQKPHEGVSSARNAGIEKADGDYVLFMDSDDEYIGDVSSVLPKITDGYPDIAAFGARVINYDSDCVVNAISPRDIVYSPFKPDALFKEEGGLPYVWNCAYKRQFLLDNGITFNAGADIGEDMVFQFKAMPKAGSVRFSSDVLYCYNHLKRKSLINECERDLRLRVKKHINLLDMVFSEWESDGAYGCYISDLVAWVYYFLRDDFRRLKGNEYGIYSGQLRCVFKKHGIKFSKLDIGFKRKLRLCGLTRRSCRFLADYVKKPYRTYVK